ncbi:MAG: heparan-alpha-glucosaminide N-acetyltransferase domain-containing protein [Polyangiaceae bacterium]
MAATPKNRERSEPGLDVLRALAVVLMFAVHVRRLQSPTTTATVIDRGLQWLMWAEPYITSLFVYMAGYSVVLATRSLPDGAKLLRRVSRRAVELVLISIGLYVMQFGIGWPDIVLSSGILQVIAIGVVGVALCLNSPLPDAALASVALLSLAACFLLEAFQLSVSGLNAGPGGNIPLLAHACFGALTARVWQGGQLRSRLLSTAGIAVGSGLAVIAPGPWTTNHVSHYKDLGGETFVSALLSGSYASAPTLDVSFWNHSTRGAVILLAPLVASTALALWPRFMGAPALLPLRLVGRHALVIYAAHLCALGALQLLDLHPKSGAQSLAWILGLLLLGIASAATMEQLRARLARP